MPKNLTLQQQQQKKTIVVIIQTVVAYFIQALKLDKWKNA